MNNAFRKTDESEHIDELIDDGFRLAPSEMTYTYAAKTNKARVLDISRFGLGANYGKHSCTGFFDQLSSCVDLRELNISSNLLASLGRNFSKFCQSLVQLKKLQRLNLSGNSLYSLNQVQCEALAQVFSNLPYLQHLDISDNQIRVMPEENLNILIRGLYGCRSLWTIRGIKHLPMSLRLRFTGLLESNRVEFKRLFFAALGLLCYKGNPNALPDFVSQQVLRRAFPYFSLSLIENVQHSAYAYLGRKFTWISKGIQEGDLVKVKRLLNGHSNLDSTDHFLQMSNDEGHTLLHLAVMSQAEHSEKIVKYLLDIGLNPNQKDLMGWAPVNHALHRGRVELAKIFLDYPVKWQNRTLQGYSMLRTTKLGQKLYPEGQHGLVFKEVRHQFSRNRHQLTRTGRIK